MTDAPDTTTEPEVVDLTVAESDLDTEVDDSHFLFRLSMNRRDGSVLTEPRVMMCRRPKGGWWIKMMRATGNGAADVDKMPLMEQIALAEHFTQIIAPDDRTYLIAKFEDADSPWDYDALVPVIKAAQERWFARPTGRSAGSSRTRSTGGSGSTARARSGAQTRARSRKTG